MNNQPRIPDPERRARSVARMREVCAQFDEQIAVLDQLSAQLETENKQNPVNIYFEKRRQQQGLEQRQSSQLISS